MTTDTDPGIEALRALHHPFRATGYDECCEECGSRWPWPCPTARLFAAYDQLYEWRDEVGCGAGCQCEGGDGEEWCVGTCIARAERDAAMAALDIVQWDHLRAIVHGEACDE